MMGLKSILIFALVIVVILCAVAPSNAIIVIEDIKNAVTFVPTESLDVPYYSLIKDNEDGTLYLGSSGYIYKVDTSNFLEIWYQNISKQVADEPLSCEDTTPEDQARYWCENQISVIEEIGDDQLLVCGTNAGVPRCWNCNMTDGFDMPPTSCDIYPEGRIEGYLPKRPDFDSTWLYNKSSNLVYAGTEREASSKSYFAKVPFDEFFLQSSSNTLTNNPSNENWLNMPAFVGEPVHRGDYIYFFFRETATEYKNAGKIIYSRVGRICADNDAPRHSSLRNFYQTLVKARLNCSIDLEFPFYFNEIQDVYLSGDIIYAVFTTPSEGPPASAVCAFSWPQIEDLFNNKAGYKGQETTNSDWLRKSYNSKLGLTVRPGTCGHRFGSPEELNAVNNYNLIDELVPSIRSVMSPPEDSSVSSESPLLYFNGYRFKSIVKIEEGATENKIVFMIGTADMRILKAYFNTSVEPQEYGSIVSEIELGSGEFEVRDIVPYTEGEETYVIATAVEKAVKIPVVYCEYYTTCDECKGAKDPDCVWKSRTCRKKSDQNEDHDTCYIKPQSQIIDIVQTFGEEQHISKSNGHHVNFYALAIGQKGCNFMSDIQEEMEEHWDIKIDEGTATDKEFYAIRFTGSKDKGDTLKNFPINLYCRNINEDNSVNMTVKVIQDTSDVAQCAEEIYEYDCKLARYEYQLTNIRQEILYFRFCMMVLTIKFNLRKRSQRQDDGDDSAEQSKVDTPRTSRNQSSKIYARNYREKLKSNPETWADFKEKERKRHRERRARRSEAQKSHDRELGRLRQQRFVEKQKSEELDGDKKKKQVKILTRSDRQKTREYNRIKKRESRARMTPQQKRRTREKDARRKKEQRAAKRDKQKRTRRQTPKTPSNQTSGFPSLSAKRMAVSRLWEKVPKDPEKFGDIVEDFLTGRRTTPRKKAALERRGLLPGTRKTRLFQEVMKDSLRRSVQQLKRKKDNASLRDRRLIAKAHMICKKYRMQNHLARQLDVRPNYLASLMDNAAITKPRKRRSDATSMEVIENVRAFYQTPKVSRELPYMKTVKNQVQRRVMEVSTAKAYKMWKDDSGENRMMSLSLFQKLRPENVLLQHRTKLNQCLCEYCTNILMKLQSFNKAAQVFNLADLKVRDKYELIELSMCPKEGKFARRECIERECGVCGIQLLREKFSKLEDEHGDCMIHWLKWMDHKYDHGGKTKSKKVIMNRREPLRELLKELLNETETLSKHLFVANWQQDQFTKLSRNLPEGWALLVLDFAENYSCISQDEIQSAHWSIQQVTIHPIVAYYHCIHNDQTISHITQEALVFISDDLVHDHHAVHHFEKAAIKHLREGRGLHIDNCVEFTDGCAAQYKARGPFADISFAKQDHGINLQRSYFGSRHGKGPSDGVSGVVKSTVRRAVISRRAVINTAKDMFDYCKDNMTLDSCHKQKRSFFLVQKNEIERERPEREVKVSLPGTRSLHSVKCVEPGVVDTRPLSCFCDGCLSNPPDVCTRIMHTAPWKRQMLKMTTKGNDVSRHIELFNELGGVPTGEDNQPLEVLDISLTEIIETLSAASDDTQNHNKGTSDEPQPENLEPEVLTACLSINQIIGQSPQSHDGIQHQDEGSTSSQSSIDGVEVNSYVAIRFDPVKQNQKAPIYMAMVTEKSNEYTRVKFMRRKKQNRYVFTQEKESTHPTSDILKKMIQPIMVSEGRAFLYEFQKKELEDLEIEFELK